MKSAKAKLEASIQAFDSRKNDREVYKIMLGCNKNISHFSPKALKNFKIEKAENIFRKGLSKRLNQESSNKCMRKSGSIKLHPNLGLREIILDPSRKSKLEVKDHRIT